MHLVDTNVVSELLRPRPSPGILRWAGKLSRFALSVVTLEEIRYGLAVKGSARLDEKFEAFVADFCDVLPVTPAVARRSATLRAFMRARGTPRTQADMLIAATCGRGGDADRCLDGLSSRAPAPA